VKKLDIHANPDAQRDNLAPDISVYADDNVPDADAKTHSATLRTHCNRKQKTFASRTTRMFLDSIVANYIHIQRITQGLSFASAPSPYRYADDLQDSFVGIAAARLLPRASTTLNNRIFLPTFSGFTHISIIASADTTLPSRQHRRRISNRSSMSKTVCGLTILPIVNSV
jgi:hypothetical protein